MTIPLFDKPVVSENREDYETDENTSISELLPISEDEFCVNELESRLKALGHEIELTEQTLTMIGNANNCQQEFDEAKKQFAVYVQNCRQLCRQEAKRVSQESMSYVQAERDVFRIRKIYMTDLVDKYQKYNMYLLKLINRPANPNFKVRRRILSESGKRILDEWFNAHQDHPYPNAEEKERLALNTGASVDQVTTWFINARARRGTRVKSELPSVRTKRSRTEFML